mmetsp:Transcript_12440/g.33099  ORF Transcript_12440/g.33099 Transcript_12440/m.33099 type:complete len:303 (-) Transcript_12440:180-1088(-)
MKSDVSFPLSAAADDPPSPECTSSAARAISVCSCIASAAATTVDVFPEPVGPCRSAHTGACRRAPSTLFRDRGCSNVSSSVAASEDACVSCPGASSHVFSMRCDLFCSLLLFCCCCCSCCCCCCCSCGVGAGVVGAVFIGVVSARPPAPHRLLMIFFACVCMEASCAHCCAYCICCASVTSAGWRLHDHSSLLNCHCEFADRIDPANTTPSSQRLPMGTLRSLNLECVAAPPVFVMASMRASISSSDDGALDGEDVRPPPPPPLKMAEEEGCCCCCCCCFWGGVDGGSAFLRSRSLGCVCDC